MQCEKCNTEMEKKNEFESGNARFQRYQCNGCWSERSQALGIVDKSMLDGL